MWLMRTGDKNISTLHLVLLIPDAKHATSIEGAADLKAGVDVKVVSPETWLDQAPVDNLCRITREGSGKQQAVQM
ncbi:MAG: hypothetical protein NVSMB52_00500 [Chloroflexota bacterium]